MAPVSMLFVHFIVNVILIVLGGAPTCPCP